MIRCSRNDWTAAQRLTRERAFACRRFFLRFLPALPVTVFLALKRTRQQIDVVLDKVRQVIAAVRTQYLAHCPIVPVVLVRDEAGY